MCGRLAHSSEPCCGLPQPPAQASPMPKTPTAAALIQSLLGASPRSASCASPMEGVPERFGPVLQPKTPVFVSLSFLAGLHKHGPGPHSRSALLCLQWWFKTRVWAVTSRTLHLLSTSCTAGREFENCRGWATGTSLAQP